MGESAGQQLRRITPPAHDPLFSDEEYNHFLAALGYTPVAARAWGKAY